MTLTTLKSNWLPTVLVALGVMVLAAMLLFALTVRILAGLLGCPIDRCDPQEDIDTGMLKF